MKTTRNDMAEMATAGASVYGLLAAVFRAEPDEAFLEQLKGPGISGALDAVGLSLGEEFRTASTHELLENLSVEFTRLFIGPGPHLSPHESVHVEIDGDSGNLWGAKTVEVKRFIEATGLRYEDSFTGLPDHISAEFELLQKLAERESLAWTDGEERSAAWCRGVHKRFLEEHLVRWVPGFCDKVMDQTDLNFYRTMAALTKAFLQFEQTTLEQVVDGARGAPD